MAASPSWRSHPRILFAVMAAAEFLYDILCANQRSVSEILSYQENRALVSCCNFDYFNSGIILSLADGTIQRTARKQPVKATILKKGLAVYLSAVLLFPFAASAAIFTMEFEGIPVGATGATTPSAPYTEDGMTMSVVHNHYDAYATHPVLSPTAGDKNPVIHEGNGGSGVLFSYAGGAAFDLLSFDMIGWFFGTVPVVLSTSVTVSSSAGGLHVINATDAGPNFTGLLDFSAISGFSNITSFSLVMPNPGTTCLNGNNCPNLAFDNVVFQVPPTSPVPLPGAFGLVALSLAGIGLSRKRPRNDTL